MAPDRLDRSYQELRRQADLIPGIEEQLRRADGEAHGGRIDADNRPEGGARFTQPPAPAPKVSMAKVLVVDDAASLRRVLEYNPAQEGHAVVTAAGGEEALAALARSRFDIVVTDIHMPGMHGMGRTPRQGPGTTSGRTPPPDRAKRSAAPRGARKGVARRLGP